MKTLLLFAHHSDFLGEVRLQNGAFANMMLTKSGEERIGPAVKDWQTRGVPIRREVFGTRQSPHNIIFYQERIQPRDAAFGQSLQRWCEERKISVIVLSSALQADCWAALLRLPLESAERFVMLAAQVHADVDELVAWRAFLAETEQAVAEESRKADTAIVALQQKAAEGLAKRFSTSSRKGRGVTT